MSRWSKISQHIARATGTPFEARQQHSIGGGCINSAYIVSDGAQSYFVKTNTLDKYAMFAAEAAGLQVICASRSIRAPHPICQGTTDDLHYLVLEYIALEAGNNTSAAKLGEQLAAMHRVTASRFGWDRDNAIGATPQINTWGDDWVHFFGEHRLRFQLDLATRNGYPYSAKGGKLIDRLADFFQTYRPQPALLHGDLWGGNWAEDTQGQPVIFDPALYFGDRETDIAMTELFGGFPPAFYRAYTAAYPLDAGYDTRKDLYNLYHILNHYNLFGGAYGRQATQIIDRLLVKLA